ncbi:MAG: efflux RND transporter periplasmic adaptor subunit [Chitinophagaceae bacterium]|nr:efflux RND transporter periplasmic adaptor subunit [Bacteroidota bacterium]MCC6258657.1 efflux RND transporter periplasmic adaptor subunit [Chitinophagaceae bacterium]MCW5917870.1 efflux RND transporter periplasmic adaptor subunit [Ferruginibacter sp.]
MKHFQNIFFIFGVSLLLYSCAGKGGQPGQSLPPAVPVTVATVTPTQATYFETFPATINALDQINLTSQVSGYVTGIYFKDGQQVKKGQLLYSIDAQIYQANYQQAVANLQVQEANLVKAQKDADRYNELEKQDAIAKQQVDYANAALEATKKQVAAAKASVSSLGASVSFTRIYAPFSGTIGISQVKKGTVVVAGQTILNTVSTDNPVAVDFTIDQKSIYHFTQLQQDKKVINDSVFTIAFGDDVYPVPGSISVMDRAVDPQTGTIKVRLTFPNEKGMLKPGMNTTVRVRNAAPANATIIPHIAISEQLGEFTVFVVGDSAVVHQQKVILGAGIGDSVIISEGVKPGDRVVVKGVQNMHDGTKVVITQ